MLFKTWWASARHSLQIHHRGSLIPFVHEHNEKIGCQHGEQYFSSASPNPNLLTESIFRGPDKSDNYQDDRSEYWEGSKMNFLIEIPGDMIHQQCTESTPTIWPCDIPKGVLTSLPYFRENISTYGW